MAQVPQENPSLPYVPTVKAQDSLFAPVHSIPAPPEPHVLPLKLSVSHFCTDGRWSWLMLDSLPIALLTTGIAYLGYQVLEKCLPNPYSFPVLPLLPFLLYNTDFRVILITLNFRELLKPLMYQYLGKATVYRSEMYFELVVFISNGILVMNVWLYNLKMLCKTFTSLIPDLWIYF